MKSCQSRYGFIVLDDLELPLSWAQIEGINDLRFRSLILPSGITFIPDADVPSDWDGEKLGSELFRRFPKGFLLRGVSKTFFSLLNEVKGRKGLRQISLGSSALLEASKFKPDKKLRNLVRRSEQELVFDWIKLNAKSSARLEALKAAARGENSPDIEYFFRTDFNSCQAVFGASRESDSEPMGAIAICRYGKSSWHSEPILRHPGAPPGTMEGIIVKLFDCLQKEGATNLNLGEVPLTFPEGKTSRAGKEDESIAQRLLLRHGDKLAKLTANSYNIEGLYRFKDKFATTWEPRFYAGTPKIYLRDLWAFARLSKSTELFKRPSLRRKSAK